MYLRHRRLVWQQVELKQDSPGANEVYDLPSRGSFARSSSRSREELRRERYRFESSNRSRSRTNNNSHANNRSSSSPTPNSSPHPGLRLQTQIPKIKNHTSTAVGDRYIFVFGGYDGHRNLPGISHEIHILDYQSMNWLTASTTGDTLRGRNGHTATYADGYIYVIGGWRGASQGEGGRNEASKEVCRLNVETLHWSKLHNVPGPCNMHTAEFLDCREDQQIIVLRGGDGEAYHNDILVLDLSLQEWELPKAIIGLPPRARANHGSALIDNKIFLFGGWDGRDRLNDLHILEVIKKENNQGALGSQRGIRNGGKCQLARPLFV